MPHQNLKELSKQDFANSGETEYEHIQVGCLQRIASATEAMAKNHTELQNQNAWYRKQHAQHIEDIQGLQRQISSLKGVITKLKKKQAK